MIPDKLPSVPDVDGGGDGRGDGGMESQMERSLRSSFSPTQWQESVVDGDRPNEPGGGATALISQLVGNR